MFIHNNGYVSGALILLPHIKKMRAHVEFEKFQCRVLRDDETTRQFKAKTHGLREQIYALRYNNDEADKMTAAGKKTNGNQDT